MATKTRTLKQYLTYEVVDVQKVELTRGDHKVPGESFIPVAMFDDQDLMNTYLKAWQEAIPEAKWSIREEWSNLKPEPTNFSLPLNPVYSKTE